MSTLTVIVVGTPVDLTRAIATGLLQSIAARSDMTLIEHRSVEVDEVDALLEKVPPSAHCAVIVATPAEESARPIGRWLRHRSDLVVMHIDVDDDTVRFTVRDLGLDALLSSLRDFAERAGKDGGTRVARVHLCGVPDEPPEAVPLGAPVQQERPLLNACVDWLDSLLREAVNRLQACVPPNTDRSSLVQRWFEPAPTNSPPDVSEAWNTLFATLNAAEHSADRLAALFRGLGFDLLELQMLLLSLAPELDPRFQLRIGFVLEDTFRRVGTVGVYAWLLGPAARVRADLARGGALDRWQIFERNAGQPPGADEPLRVDPFLVQWLLGAEDALGSDPRVRRAMRVSPWAGWDLLERSQEHNTAKDLLDLVLGAHPGWIVLDGGNPAGWRALLEVGAREQQVTLLRVEAAHLVELDLIDVEDCARRLGRMARLTASVLAIDLTGSQRTEGGDERLGLLFATLAALKCGAAVVCDSDTSAVRLLAKETVEVFRGAALSPAALTSAFRAAAAGAEVHLTWEAAETMTSRYPLHIDGLDRAMRLARGRPLNHALDDPRHARFTAACKEVAAEGVSHLADRIEPVFDIDDVVLPEDRRAQLVEIVDNVRLASQVLDEWKFRDRLPYGRGVTALFFGPPGTGKTMAASGIARRLGMQILRLDLSRVMSKYIGDTEKHVDQVFSDAQRSGSAIVIDEAEALLGKRSDVRDAHDRYANIEVAYLLQRMETFDGLAILTTNMRQTLDSAFLRRLRFVIDFPRPDAEARERIWRQCLPDGSHTLDDQTFRHLGRRLDITGGYIRQITLRAAFVAAAANGRIGRQHIAHAARAELTKLGMPPIDIDPPRSREAA